MIPERNMKQAKRVDNGEIVDGYFFYMQYGGCEVPCIAIEPLSANDYSEIYSSCYCMVDLDTVEDVAVRPIPEHDGDGQFVALHCPNCDNVISDFYQPSYCDMCGQRIDWSE